TKDTRSYSDWTLSGDGRFLAGNVRTLLLPRVGFANLPEDWEEAPPPEITIWDTSQLIRLETLTGHEVTGMDNRMTFAADGQWLLSAVRGPEVRNPMLRLWDLRNVDRNNPTTGKAGNDQGHAGLQPSVQVVKYDTLQETIKQCRGK